MTDKEILKELMKSAEVTCSVLAKKMNYSTPSGVTEKLRRKSAMRVDSFAKMVDALGGKVVIRKGVSEFELDSWLGKEEA